MLHDALLGVFLPHLLDLIRSHLLTSHHCELLRLNDARQNVLPEFYRIHKENCILT